MMWLWTIIILVNYLQEPPAELMEESLDARQLRTEVRREGAIYIVVAFGTRFYGGGGRSIEPAMLLWTIIII